MTDATHLLESIERHHPEPYREVAPETLRQQARRVDDAATDRDREIVELMRLTALLGERNGHTAILPWREQPHPFALYPLRGYEFEDGVFVVAAADRELIGCELIAIAGVPLAEVLAEVTPLVSHDNEWTIRERRPRYLMVPEVLRGLAIDPAWRVRTPDGRLRDVAVEPLRAPHWQDLLFESRPPRTIEEVADGRALHVAYNVTRGETASFAAEIKSHATPGIVLDLRHNSGGDNTTYGPLLAALEALTAAGTRLVVLISRVTFSAAMNLVVDLEQRTPSVFVGEPTGASPNHYGDAVTVDLPHTGIAARVAAISWTPAGEADERSTREPDVAVPVSAGSYFSGDDPVLAAAVELLG